MLGSIAVHEAADMVGNPCPGMDTKLAASHTFSGLNFIFFCEVGIITFTLKLRNWYFKSRTDSAQVSDLGTQISVRDTQN